jgi:hypothetical protein
MNYKYNSLLISLVFPALLFSSCVGTRSDLLVQGKNPAAGWQYNFWLQRSDLEELGEVSDSIRYTSYLGINLLGSNKDFRNTKRIAFPASGISLDSYLSRVMYRLYEKSPNADIIIPTRIITRKERLFLGSRKVVSVTGKAYKIK